MQQTTPFSTVESDPWAPSMPNSDYYILLSAKDAAEAVTPKGQRGRTIIPRRVVAMRTSPLGRFAPVNAAYPPSYPPVYPAAPATTAPPQAPIVTVPLGIVEASSSKTGVPASPEAPPASSSRAIGLGHPSTSQRRNMALTQEAPAFSQASSSPRARINSSTIRARTGRFQARELHAIVEDPVIQPSATPPVPGTRKRSYAAAASAKKSTSRRVTPTQPPTPGSPRCASKPGGTSASSGTALEPRHTTSGSPLAGPRQVQSPRVLFPANLAGSPQFQSLDGAILAIAAASEAKEVREAAEASEAEEQGGEEGSDFAKDDWAYSEDRFIKFKVHAKFQIRLAGRRLKMLF